VAGAVFDAGLRGGTQRLTDKQAYAGILNGVSLSLAL
jgi:hypothetical protein